MDMKIRKLEKKWLVFYTKARSEKKAFSYLQKFGFEAYLPLHMVLRQWSDRRKKVEVPLFNSYIFVKEHESRIANVLKVPGIVWNVRHNDKPAVLREEELETIKRFINTGYFIETHTPDNLEIGDTVEVMDGPLRGATGYLSGEYNDEKFTLVMETINQALTISIDKKLLKKMDD